MLSREQGHFLLQLAQVLDFVALESACAGYHHQSGPGSPVTHSVPRLVRALLVKYLLNLSLRELEQAIRWNVLVKWFVGYALFEAGPDHATLERFEQWVCKHQHRCFFDEVLRQIDETFPDERQKTQLGDTYAMCANAAAESLIHLLRHSCQRLLNTFAQVADERELADLISQLDEAALFGAEDEPKTFRLDAEQRRQRLHQIVVAILHCQALVQTYLNTHSSLPEAQQLALTNQLSLLDKILSDEVAICRDEQGQVTAVHELPKDKKGSYRIASATDTDATFRVHDDDITFGYNINLAATDTFIREIRADTGCQPDAVAIPDLLTAQEEHHDLLPEKFIYDKAAGTGKTHAEVEKATGGQTQLVAPLIDYAQRSERFGPDDFTLSADGDSLTCPNNQISTTAYRSQSAEGRVFRFSPQQCADCPLAQACRGEQVPADHMRQVYISDHRSQLAQARTYAQTPDFEQDMALRPTVERIIANLVRYHGGRQARRRGLNHADYQAKLVLSLSKG